MVLALANFSQEKSEYPSAHNHTCTKLTHSQPLHNFTTMQHIQSGYMQTVSNWTIDFNFSELL